MTLNMSNNGIHIIPANTINLFSGLKKTKLKLETSIDRYFKAQKAIQKPTIRDPVSPINIFWVCEKL